MSFITFRLPPYSMKALADENGCELFLRGSSRGLLSLAFAIVTAAVVILLGVWASSWQDVLPIAVIPILCLSLAVIRLTSRVSVKFTRHRTAEVLMKSVFRTRRWPVDLDDGFGGVELAPLSVIGMHVGGPWRGWGIIVVGRGSPPVAICTAATADECLAFAAAKLPADVLGRLRKTDQLVLAVVGVF